VSYWVVVLDLDQEPCAVTYVKSLLPERAAGMILRIAVREIEAWLLADRERIAAFLHVAVANVPLNPDLEPDPKATLINLARRCRKKALRDDIVPRLNSGLKIGPGYAGRISEFVTKEEYRWRPEVAAEHSDSLKRCIRALKNWKVIR